MGLDENLEAYLKKAQPEEPVHIIIRIKEQEKAYLEETMSFPSAVLRHQVRMCPSFSLKIFPAEIEEFLTLPWVEKIEKDELVYACGESSGSHDSEESPPSLRGLFQFPSPSLKGESVRVAIIGTGLDKNHPDFESRIKATADFTLEGFRDLNGQGTHLAGAVSGSGQAVNQSGSRQASKDKYRGVAPKSQILAAKALKDDGTGRMSDVMAAIEWAVESQAQIINLSLGISGPSDGSDALSEICDEAVRRGVVVCVAAGNGGPQRRTIGSPASARGVITVGAINDRDEVADFSSHGPTLDGRIKPDIVAPGVDIVAARAEGVSQGKVIDDLYTRATGTSISAALTSGLAALFLEAKKEASPLLIKEALMHTAKDLEAPEESQGAGRVEPQAALEYLKTHENPPELAEMEHKPGYLTFFLELGYLIREKLKPQK